MSVAFVPGQIIGRGDLDIFLTNSSGNPSDAYSITYAIYYVDPTTHLEILIGDPVRIPMHPAVGEYYASLQVPVTALAGDYRIRWTFQELAGSQPQTVVQEWAVVVAGTVTGPTYTLAQQDMINKLRLLLRDQNPDKFYRFRPPEHEGTIGAYNRVFGQIWEDAELAEYLNRALDWWNMFPPETEALLTIDDLVAQKPIWRTAILWEAIVHACFALSINWVADEFDYSIGGISLSIEKSAKYESLKQNAESQFDKATEMKARTTKFIRGVSQPKYGIGIRSSFGPMVGRGVLSPRNFL